MDQFRNMEAVLLLLFGVVCAGALMLDPPAPSRAAPNAGAAPTAGALEPMAVVVITGKRLTPVQKRAAIEAENAGAA
jgi:hypothetical protein